MSKKNISNNNDNIESSESDKYQEPINFRERYEALKKLGSGSFGDVYLAKYKPENLPVALKVEFKKKSPRIQNEYRIYSKLHRNGYINGIPAVYEFVETSDCNIMAMELLGASLDELFKDNNSKFSVSCVLKLGYQIVSLLEIIHKKGYIHRDLKPNNFLIGYKEKKKQVYIMDFGLSKKYIDKNGHIPFKSEKQLVGTPRYVSINMHLGIEPTRRDDLESLGYMLVYFLKGFLPWQNLKKKKGVSQVEIIGEKKMETTLKELCKDIPEVFSTYLAYCRSKLDFDSEPDYNFLKGIFIEQSNKLNLELKYDWE